VIALLSAGQHEQVVALGIGFAVLRGAELEREFGAEEGAETRMRLGGFGETHGTVEAVVIGESDGVEPEPHGFFDEGFGPGGAVEEAEVRVRVQLGIGHDGCAPRRVEGWDAGSIGRVGLTFARPSGAVSAISPVGNRVGAAEVGEFLLELGPGNRGVVPSQPGLLSVGQCAGAACGGCGVRGCVRVSRRAPRPTTRVRRG
jgi:hypothetical protein